MDADGVPDAASELSDAGTTWRMEPLPGNSGTGESDSGGRAKGKTATKSDAVRSYQQQCLYLRRPRLPRWTRSGLRECRHRGDSARRRWRLAWECTDFVQG